MNQIGWLKGTVPPAAPATTYREEEELPLDENLEPPVDDSLAANPEPEAEDDLPF